MITPVVASRNPLRVRRQQNSQAPGRRFVIAPCTSQGLGGGGGTYAAYESVRPPDPVPEKRTLEKCGLVGVFIGSVGVIRLGICLG